jgi:hypothetical protein
MDNEYRSPAEVWQVLSLTRQTESPGWVSGEPAEEAEVVSVEEAEIWVPFMVRQAHHERTVKTSQGQYTT